MLTTEQWLLKNYLEKNFRPNYYFSVEEVCNNVLRADGTPIYKLNTSEKCHAKCIKLWKDIRDINYDCEQGQKIIIKNKQGGMKYAESEEEFNAWRDHELKKVEKQYKYLNNLKWKANRDGDIPLLNQALNVNSKCDSINCYAKCYQRVFIDLENQIAYVVTMKKYIYEEEKNKVTCELANGEKIILTNIRENISTETVKRPFYENYKFIYRK